MIRMMHECIMYVCIVGIYIQYIYIQYIMCSSPRHVLPEYSVRRTASLCTVYAWMRVKGEIEERGSMDGLLLWMYIILI
jgi:hypothetical protein